MFKSIIFSSFILFFTACGGDNAYDGENGLVSGESSSGTVAAYIESIYSEVIEPSVDASYIQSIVVIGSVTTLQTTFNEENLLAAQDEFKKLALTYKKVESSYIAGRESDDMRDIADFRLESFIVNSKGDTLFSSLDQIFSGTGALNKNSYKGITALEYTLFDEALSTEALIAKFTDIRLESAITMAETISSNLKLVQDYYTNTSTFLDDSDTATSLLLNLLVDNTYKLKENRIGDAAGYTVKYEDNPSAQRLEYWKSIHTLQAIQAILATHQSIMNKGLTEISIAGNASSEGEAISDNIAEALAITLSYTSSLEDELTSTKTRELYNSIANLQNNYTALINGLNFEQDIIEADGD